jgi:hypothetical protein
LIAVAQKLVSSKTRVNENAILNHAHRLNNNPTALAYALIIGVIRIETVNAFIGTLSEEVLYRVLMTIKPDPSLYPSLFSAIFGEHESCWYKLPGISINSSNIKQFRKLANEMGKPELEDCVKGSKRSRSKQTSEKPKKTKAKGKGKKKMDEDYESN